jgi:NifU-like protein
VTYPSKIVDLINSGLPIGRGGLGGGTAAAANFDCGCTVRFHIEIAGDQAAIDQITFSSNGCGFMVAAAAELVETYAASRVDRLEGLNREKLVQNLLETSQDIPACRLQCVETAVNALRSAFDDLRRRRVEEFKGEGALICSCFGVSEERIETEIARKHLSTVEEVGAACRAGTGCGACTMLISELLDQAASIE